MPQLWSSIVRGPEQLTKPKVVFHAFCADCGADADVCKGCNTLAVVEDAYCGRCFSMKMPSESMCMGYINASKHAEKIPFKCSSCRAENPWRWEEDKEIIGYSYVPMCVCHALSPSNVIRIVRYRTLGNKPTSPTQRLAEARAAVDAEMAFSGSYTQAMKIYASFFQRTEPTLEQILAGRPVSGTQFLAALAAQ